MAWIKGEAGQPNDYRFTVEAGAGLGTGWVEQVARI
jgi:hypothetical protein